MNKYLLEILEDNECLVATGFDEAIIGFSYGLETKAVYDIDQVLDILQTGTLSNAILNTSATCHMPDVLEMPYRPNVLGADLPDKRAFTYQLGGLSCLAGDVIGRYSFEKPLKINDRVIFRHVPLYNG